MSTAACLGIDAFDINNSELVTWDDTALVKVETVEPFCLCFVHEGFGDRVAFVDDPVGLIFYFHFFILGQALEMCDIQVSLLGGLLSTMLPNVRSQNLSA